MILQPMMSLNSWKFIGGTYTLHCLSCIIAGLKFLPDLKRCLEAR